MSVDRVAEEIGVSTPTVYRFEAGTSIPRPGDVRTIGEFYGVDKGVTDALVALAKSADVPGWWRSYNGGVPKWFDLFMGLEEAASLVRAYNAELVWGMLQTRRYAEAMVAAAIPPPAAHEGRQRVAVRMERQRLVTHRKAPQFDVILGEAVLMRAPSAEVMAEQLHKLDGVSRLPNVTLRILPLTGVHPALDCGARFTCLTFPPGRRGIAEPPVVFADSLCGATYLDRPEEINAYDRVWEALRTVTLSPADSRRVIGEYRERYES